MKKTGKISGILVALAATFMTADAAIITISGNQILQGQTSSGELSSVNNGAGNNATAIQVRNGYTLTVLNGAIVNLSQAINVSQGVNGNGANVTQNAGSTVNIGTSLNMSGNAATGGTSFYTVLGTLTIDDDLNAGAAFAATFSLIGDSATVSVGRAVNAKAKSTFEFELNATGVSSIDAVGALTVDDGAKLVIDGSAYAGGNTDITLFDAASMTGSFAASDITVTGLGVKGTGWTLTQGTNGDVVLGVIPEPAAVTLVALTGLSFLFIKRRLTR